MLVLRGQHSRAVWYSAEYGEIERLGAVFGEYETIVLTCAEF